MEIWTGRNIGIHMRAGLRELPRNCRISVEPIRKKGKVKHDIKMEHVHSSVFWVYVLTDWHCSQWAAAGIVRLSLSGWHSFHPYPLSSWKLWPCVWTGFRSRIFLAAQILPKISSQVHLIQLLLSISSYTSWNTTLWNKLTWLEWLCNSWILQTYEMIFFTKSFYL